MLVQRFGPAGARRLAVVAVDRGPGISRLGRMLKDGVTTKSSPGTGLGAMKRLSDRLDVFTQAGVGTTVVAEFLPGAAEPGGGPDVADLRVACPGEKVCGDNVAVRQSSGVTRLFVCDGLGHGRRAAEAADLARKAFFDAGTATPVETLGMISDAIAQTRGAVGSIVEIDPAERRLVHAGVGNITTLHVTGEKSKRLVVRDGFLGARWRTPLTETVDLGEDDIVLMHSDGLTTLRAASRRRPLFQRSALAIAAHLLHQNNRERDDASIIAARMRQVPGLKCS